MILVGPHYTAHRESDLRTMRACYFRMARRWTPGPTTGGIDNECVLNDGARTRCGDGDAQNLVKQRLRKIIKKQRNVQRTTVKVRP